MKYRLRTGSLRLGCWSDRVRARQCRPRKQTSRLRQARRDDSAASYQGGNRRPGDSARNHCEELEVGYAFMGSARRVPDNGVLHRYDGRSMSPSVAGLLVPFGKLGAGK